MDEQKYHDVYIAVTENPIIIVGQNPGHQGPGPMHDFCWHYNRSANLLHEIIDDYDNIVLTNICQYRQITPDKLQEGARDLKAVVDTFKPRRIICLGNISYNNVRKIHFEDDVEITKLPHPSFVLRFNKDKNKYTSDFKSLLH